MADYIDVSNEMAEVYLTESLKWRKPEVQHPGGKCLNCEADLTPEARWCDADCREDWEKRNPKAAIPPELRRRSFGFGGGLVSAPGEVVAATLFLEAERMVAQLPGGDEDVDA